MPVVADLMATSAGPDLLLSLEQHYNQIINFLPHKDLATAIHTSEKALIHKNKCRE